MLYIIFLTGRCNLSCKYCGGTIPEYVMPHDVQYSVDDLKKFISRDENPSIAFYGGEPLLRIDLMEEIMDKIKAEHYILQTNGLLLDRVEDEYLQRFSTILVSIDGVRDVNDFYKGNVYERVIRNVKLVKEKFDGELIARMVASEKTDIFRDVLHLLSLGFTHAHWQLNAVWSPDDLWTDFRGWVKKYNEGISKLAEYWVKKLEEGMILGIVPFLGVLKPMFFEPNTSPPCGSGVNSFAITTDGRVVACPICADMVWNEAGTLESNPKELKKVELLEPCKSCKYSYICGGRCLFFNYERIWGEEGFRLVCETVKHLIREMERIKPRIEELVKMGVVSLEDFYYPKYNNTTEIIP